MGSGLRAGQVKMKSSIYLLAITLMVAGASAWPQWVQRLMSRDEIESMKEGSWKASPFSLGQHAMATDQDVTKEELKFMAEFSRFMNYRIPHLLQEFANRKKIYSTKKKVMMAQRMLNRSTRDVEFRYEDLAAELDDEDLAEGDYNDHGDPYNRQAVEEEEDEDVQEEVEEGGDVINDAVDVVTDVVDEAADTLDEAVDEAIDDAVDALGDNAVGDAAEGAADAASEIGENAAALATDIIDQLTSSGGDIVELFQEIIASVGEVLEDTVPPSAWNYMCLATWWPLHEEHCQQARCAACAPAVTTASAVCKRSFGPEGQTHKCVQTVMGEGFSNYCIDDYL